MNLSEEALKIASEELNRLAKEKMTLESELKKLGPAPKEIDVKTQVLFMENQVRNCISGWSKASHVVQKRLLRRTIKEIIVTADEIKIAFWKSDEEQNSAYAVSMDKKLQDVADLQNYKTRILGTKKPAQGGFQDQNSLFESSGVVENW